MALANIVTNLASSLGVSEFGTANFMRIEDQFVTGGSEFVGTNSLKENNPQEILIACKNKRRRVCGILNEGIKLSGESKWEEMFGGGITAIGGSLVNMVNKGLQGFRGTSIQQPWMNRKFWNSTKPFSFSFSFNFIEDGNGGKTDVWEPTQALLSFVFPRDLGTGEQIKKTLDNARGIDTSRANTDGGKGLITAGVDAIATEFAIPGPSVRYSPDNKSNTTISSDSGESVGDKGGDAVTLVIGNLFAFGGVYLEKVDVEYSPNMDTYGYPLWAKCTVQATVMDVNYCQTNGDFMISQFANSQGAMSSLLDSIATFGSDVGENVKKIFKATTKKI